MLQGLASWLLAGFGSVMGLVQPWEGGVEGEGEAGEGRMCEIRAEGGQSHEQVSPGRG